MFVLYHYRKAYNNAIDGWLKLQKSDFSVQFTFLSVFELRNKHNAKKTQGFSHFTSVLLDVHAIIVLLYVIF